MIERDLDAFGRTINLALRIAGHAQAGEVLATEAVASAVHDDAFRFDPLRQAPLKGIPDPVPLYRITRTAFDDAIAREAAAVTPQDGRGSARASTSEATRQGEAPVVR